LSRDIRKKFKFIEKVSRFEEEFGLKKGMVEESPFSYKDVEEVVRVSHEAGLGRKVVRLRPILVVIG